MNLDHCKGGGNCLCVKCDLVIPHQKEKPCVNELCPECGGKLIREGSYHHQLYLAKMKGNESKKGNQK